MNPCIIYAVHYKGTVLRYYREMEDAVDYCRDKIYNEVGKIYDNLRYCVDEKSDRYCLVGYNGGYGNIMDYEVRAIDVY